MTSTYPHAETNPWPVASTLPEQPRFQWHADEPAPTVVDAQYEQLSSWAHSQLLAPQPADEPWLQASTPAVAAAPARAPHPTITERHVLLRPPGRGDGLLGLAAGLILLGLPIVGAIALGAWKAAPPQKPQQVQPAAAVAATYPTPSVPSTTQPITNGQNAPSIFGPPQATPTDATAGAHAKQPAGPAALRGGVRPASTHGTATPQRPGTGGSGGQRPPVAGGGSGGAQPAAAPTTAPAKPKPTASTGASTGTPAAPAPAAQPAAATPAPAQPAVVATPQVVVTPQAQPAAETAWS